MSEEDWNIECSDEEYAGCIGPWEPSPEIIDKMYTMMDNGEMPVLKWKCPGYRAPSPEIKETPEQETDFKQTEDRDKSDFDFMDEANTPKLKIRNKGEESLKGSAKKKTTSLDGVINNMRRHNLLPASQNTTGSTGQS